MKKILAIILTLAMLLVMAGCSSNEEVTSTESNATSPVENNVTEVVDEGPKDKDGNRPMLGYVAYAMEYEYFATTSHYLEQYCNKYGWDYVAQGGDFTDPSTQADIIENFIVMGVDAIVLNPISPEACTDAIKAADEAGVIVIGQGFHPDSPGAEYCTFFCSADQYQVGVDMSTMGVEHARKLMSDEEIKVCVMMTKDGEGNVLKSNGMLETAKELLGEDAVLAEVYPTDTSEAMAAAEDSQVANNNAINLWICFNDNQALGVYQYYVSNNLDQSKAVIVGTDGITSALELLQQGGTAFRATRGSNYTTMNEDILKACTAVLEKGEEGIAEGQALMDAVQFYTEINSDNVEDFLAVASWDYVVE